MRYMFLLKARHGYEISKECLRMLKEEHRLNKAALESAPMQEEGGVQPTVAPLYDLSYVRAVLCETAISVDEVFSEDFMLCVSISWGDWKHDHLCCRQLMQQLGYTFVREEVTEDDGSDAYSAVHYYK